MELQVGVKVVLKNPDGRILLLKRSEEKYGRLQGSLDIVGGRIDPGSPLFDNLRREVREEIGLDLTHTPRLIGAQDIFVRDERHVVRLTYVGMIEGEPVLDTEENTQFAWYSFDELAAEPDLDRYVRALIDDGTLTASSWD